MTHQFHTPPGGTTQPETPGIGETIDNENPSKLKTFFTDPKNLATMLVLASAMAQPRQGGRTPLAHTLRGGVGALAFRGGLDQAIHQQAQTDAEQASIAEARAKQASAATGAVAATRERTVSVAETAEEKLESEEEREAAALAAGKYAKTPPAGGTFPERAVLQAQKDFSDAMLNWVGLGKEGPPPQYGTYLLRAMQGAALMGTLGPDQLEFLEKLTTQTEGELTIPGGVTTPEPVKPPRPPSAKELSKEGRSSVAQHFIGKGVMDDALEAKLLRRRIPEFRTLEGDSAVIGAARQMDAAVQKELPNMTIEDARTALKERRWALSDETVQALKDKIQSLKPQTTPTAPFTEALGKLGRGQ